MSDTYRNCKIRDELYLPNQEGAKTLLARSSTLEFRLPEFLSHFQFIYIVSKYFILSYGRGFHSPGSARSMDDWSAATYYT